MDKPFPFGFPFPTAFYLTLYVVTLLLHIVFMNYLIAGLAYVTWRRLFFPHRPCSRIVATIRDWLPFAIGAAITAGVAPLLFVQILYSRNFYTANLLLFHRWMAVIPALIVGFYLAYLLKTRRLSTSPHLAALVGTVALICFAFTGYSWTENYLLSMQTQEMWSSQYQSGLMMFFSAQLPPRLLVWLLGALPTLAVMVGWQLWGARRRGDVIDPGETRLAARLAIVGIVLSVLCAVWYGVLLEEATHQATQSSLGRIYLNALGIGLAIEVFAWIAQARRSHFEARWLLLISVVRLVSILSGTVLREIVRVTSIDLPSFYEQHARAARIEGFWTFAVFMLINLGLITLVFRLVRRGLREPA